MKKMRGRLLTIGLVIILLIPLVCSISDVTYESSDGILRFNYTGDGSYTINIRRDSNIGEDGGYVWARTSSGQYQVDTNNWVGVTDYWYSVEDTESQDTGVIGVECVPECNLGARQCTSATTVAVCLDEPYGCPRWAYQVCTEGEVCKDGQCVVDTCIDTDNGLNYSVKGNTTGLEWGTDNTVTKTDYCITEGTKAGMLAEYYCQDGMVASVSYECSIECVDGACISCKDECPSMGYRECRSDTAFDICGNYDDDPCLEWGVPIGCVTGKICFNGDCIVPEDGAFDGYLSVATIKDGYNINEAVILTDPPTPVERITGDYDSGLRSEVVTMSDSTLPEGVFKKVDGDKITTVYNVNSAGGEQLEVSSYILEFEEEPLAKKAASIKKEAKENDQRLEEMAWYNPVKYVGKAFMIESDEVEDEIASHNRKIERDQAAVKDRISRRLGKDLSNKITGRAVDDIVVKGQFKKVFNGMALEISAKEAKELEEVSGIKSVYKNEKVEASLMDSVPVIDGDDVWNLGFTGQGVTIAILDTGIDYTHPDLGGCFGPGCKVAGGYDFVNNDNDPMDDNGHGTHCAGIAAGNGVLKGVAPAATLYAFKVLNSGGSGWFDQIMAGVERAVDPNNDGDFSDHVDIISLSLGGRGDPDDPQSKAIDAAVEAGVVAVIAAGNSGPGEGTVNSPGTARKAITVGATYKKDYTGEIGLDTNPRKNQVTSFSSRGPVEWDNGMIIKPDIVAPGAIICAAQWDGAWDDKKCDGLVDQEHVQISGTSMATPHVAGAAALLLQKNPEWNPLEIKAALKDKAVDLNNDMNIQGAGLMNILNSISILDRPLVVDIATTGNVAGIATDIVGTATGEGLTSYTLYFQTEDQFQSRSSIWQELFTGYTPVENAFIYNWDISMLEEGEYVLKLVARQGDVEYEAYSYVSVKNTVISKPLGINKLDWDEPLKETIFKPGERIDIIGTAAGVNYEGYNLNLCEKDTSLCEQIKSSTSPVINDVLGFWDVPNDIDSGYYYIRLLNTYNGNSYEDETLIYIETEFQEGWPIDAGIIGGGGIALSFMRQPTLEDLDNDGRKDVIITYGPGVVVVDSKGEFLPGFPLILFDDDRSNAQLGAPVADVDNDGYNEIVVGFNYGSVYVINHDGTVAEGWPRNYGPYVSSITLEDINNDGNLEIIYGDWDGSLHVLDAYGNQLPGWPLLRLKEPEGYHEFIMIRDGVEVVDLNNDGNKEVIVKLHACKDSETCSPNSVNASTSVYMFSKDGVLMPGWPKVFERWSKSEISIVDLDKDGNKDLLFGLGYTLQALDYQGNNIEGFPFELGDMFMFDDVKVGDLDYDGMLDIALTTATYKEAYWEDPDFVYKECIYVIDEDTNIKAGYPVCRNDYIDGKPFLIGVDDGHMNTGNLIGDYNQIAIRPTGSSKFKDELYSFYVLNPDGSMPANFPKYMDEAVLGDTLPIGDIDGDGDNELFAYTWSGMVYVWDFPGSPEKNEWPVYQHDSRHTGVYERKVQVVRPQSKIVNNGTVAIEGYLNLKVQRNVQGVWSDYRFIAANRPITINPGEVVKLDALFGEVVIEETGDYRVYVAVIDDSGSIIKTDSGLLMATWNFRVSSGIQEPEVPVDESALLDAQKATALFDLIELKTDELGVVIQGVLDKDGDFTTHQFAVVYNTLMILPEKLRNMLKILIFTNFEGEAVSYGDRGELNLGYGPSLNNYANDELLAYTVVHEMGHILETQMGIEKEFRSICYNFIDGTWQRKNECEVDKDFAPQFTEQGWNFSDRVRAAGADGREDIAYAVPYYVYGGNFFRAEAMQRNKMLEKYLFLKNELFNGLEYNCDVDGCPDVTPKPIPCSNNGCATCNEVGQSCSTLCGDCPVLHSCVPGMDCSQCYPGHPDCKYWTCENNLCSISIG